VLISGKKSVLSRNCYGFTLVELAIVMTIIGLLIGGVLQGRTMLKNAKITKTIKQIESYRAAVIAFRDKYAQMPGDMVNATQRLPGCGPAYDPAGNYCLNGGGNNIIGKYIGLGGIPQLGPGMPGGETIMFWKHLALADLITGVQANLPSDKFVEGGTNPSSPWIRMWLVYYDDGLVSWPWQWRAGHYLFIFPVWPEFANVSYRTGRKIDEKMDDGSPYSGDIVVQGDVCTKPGYARADNYFLPPPTMDNGRQCNLYARF